MVKRPKSVDPYPQAAAMTIPANGQFKESIPVMSFRKARNYHDQKVLQVVMNFLKLAYEWKSITRSSSLFSIYIIQRTVNPQSNYKTPIHPRRTWSNEIGYKNLDNNNIKQNSHETQQCNQIWSQPHR